MMGAMHSGLPWLSLLLLGGLHGINPGMGWLFATALGFQEGSARAVWRALLPLATGHAIAIAVTTTIAAAIGVTLDHDTLKWLIAAAIFGLGAWRLYRNHRHGGRITLRATSRELAGWSFLVATAHGAGLMVLPVLREQLTLEPHTSSHHLSAGFDAANSAALAATAVHSAAYLAVTGLMALLVFHRLGLRRLRDFWFNLDVLWAVALIITAVLTVV